MNNDMSRNIMPEEFSFKYENMDYKATLYQTKHYGRCSSGSDELANIKYWTYGFNKEFLGYDSIMLSNFAITSKDEEYQEAINNIVKEKVTTVVKPHIDANTGNIHPSYKYIHDKYTNDFKMINSLVLSVAVKRKDGRVGEHPGPSNPRTCIQNKDDYYNKVNQACYLPLMDDNKELKKDPRYRFLKEFANALYNEISNKEIVSEDIIQEIK